MWRANTQRSLAAAVLVGAAGPGFLAPEIWEHMGVGPVFQAALGPPVVVGAVSANIGHRVDGGRTSDHATAVDRDLTSRHGGRWFGGIHPIVASPQPIAAPSQRDVPPGVA